MALSKEAKRAYKKAQKKQRRERNKHWFFIRRGDSKKEIASKIFTQIAAVVLVVCLVIIAGEVKGSIDTFFLSDKLRDLYGEVTGAIAEGHLLPSAEALLNENPDTVGWLKVSGTKIDLPVVAKLGDREGNEYYLTHSFDGSKNKAGTVFLDYRSALGYKKQSDNLILYGHNQKDGTMFGTLKDYKNDLEFYKANPTLQFNSNYEIGDYKIIAMFVTSVLPKQDRNGEVFDYQNYIEFDEARYNDFIENVMERTQILTGVDVKYGDKFITLSTCSNEFEPSRFVVIARKVRHGEDAAVDTTLAVRNPNAKEPDWDTIYGRR